jgi:DNA-binding response OmpR family regulator
VPFPTSPDALLSSRLPELARPAQVAWLRDPRRLRILIVEDEPDIRASLQEALEARLPEAEVLAVPDATEAQRLLTNARCDIVLLDHLLPGLHGSQLLAWMRRHRVPAKTVVVTAVPEQALSSSPLMLGGAVAVVRKPVDLGHLLGVIRELAPRPGAAAPEGPR